MKVAIVGAGISGLATARTLRAAGIETCLFEKSTAPGGRCATRVQDGYVFDTGATSVAGRPCDLLNVIQNELPKDDLVEVTKPIATHTQTRFSSGDPSRFTHRYTYRQGMARLGELLAEGLEVRYESEVSKIEKAGTQVEVMGEQFDFVVCTMPLPQSIELGVFPKASLPRLPIYRPCLSIGLGYSFEHDHPFFASIDPEQTLPMTWLSFESIKSPGRAPEGCSALVAQMSAHYSRYAFEQSDEKIVHDTLVDLKRLLGERYSTPTTTLVKRWKYSQPELAIQFDAINPAGSRILVTGDGTTQGRLEFAYDAGVAAARRILQAT